VLIDSMMNLELLLWAADHGGGGDLRTIAVNHALTVRRNNVRPDGSTYQMVVFDPRTGRVRSKQTVQGLSADSTWSRGQAWGITGFTTVYRETRDARFLQTARQLADYFLAHLPADHVPLWDFDAPAGDPKDSSAAAIAASGLIELAQLDPDGSRRGRYLTAAKQILDALSSPPYRSSVTGPPSILLHGTQNKPKGVADVGLVYGDYYYLQALARYMAFRGPSVTAPQPPRAPRHPSRSPREDRAAPRLKVAVRRPSRTLHVVTIRASSEQCVVAITIRRGNRTRFLRRNLARGEHLTVRIRGRGRTRILIRATDRSGNRTTVRRVLDQRQR
jgi:unsaturated chondroitin disaccharide hydrolase